MNPLERMGVFNPTPGNLTPMSEWSEKLVSNIAATVRERRQKLELSVQDVADRTADLGHPLNRSTLSDLENGRRKDRLFIGDVLVLAEVLRIYPWELLHPAGEESVEVLPGVEVSSQTTRAWLSGSAIPPMADDWDPMNGRMVEYRYRANREQLQDLSAIQSLYHAHVAEADKLAAEGNHEEERKHREAAEGLQDDLDRWERGHDG